MMRGWINRDGNVVFPLRFRGPAGSLEVECVLDTGYDGSICVPLLIVAALGLPFLKSIPIYGVNDVRHEAAVHRAQLFWDHGWRPVQVTVTDTGALIGGEMLFGYRLTVDFVPEGAATLRRVGRPWLKRLWPW